MQHVVSVDVGDQDGWEDVDTTDDESEDVQTQNFPEVELKGHDVRTQKEERIESLNVNPGPYSWASLPYELSRRILQMLAEDQLSSKDQPRPKLLAEYAVVCKLWQSEIERVNFRSLTIKNREISGLAENVTGRRRAWLKNIWLKVELPKYSARVNLVPETEEERESNNFVYTIALFELFKVLEAWNTTEFWAGRNGRGLQLELSAYSPSDRRILFGMAGLDDDYNSRYFDSLLDFALPAIDQPEGLHGLPMVDVVTTFSILRRNFRNVSATSLTPVFRSLPRLQEVRFEPWQQVELFAQEDVEAELASQVSLWPAHLKRLSIFEHFGAFDASSFWDPRPRYRFLAHCLRRVSMSLEDFSASFITDAYDFFSPYINPQAGPRSLPPPRWGRLRWLTLTSRYIAEGDFTDELNDLLRGAGLAAKHMPALRAMELYNATNTNGAGVFRFLVVNDTGLISWTSTWDFELAASVKRTWREVALKLTRQEPYIFDEVKLANFSGDREGFIHSELATRELILHQASSKSMMGPRKIPDPVLEMMDR